MKSGAVLGENGKHKKLVAPMETDVKKGLQNIDTSRVFNILK